MFKFKTENNFGKRKEEAEKILSHWAGRIPVLIEKYKGSKMTDFSNNKFMCPTGYSVQQFIACLRKKVQLPIDTAFYLFVNGKELITGDTSMKSLYEQKKDNDGFLYILFSDLEVMG